MESIIALLIYVCILALVIYLILWVLGEVGITLPAQVIRIIWVIVALVVILMILRVIPGIGLLPHKF